MRRDDRKRWEWVISAQERGCGGLVEDGVAGGRATALFGGKKEASACYT